MKRKLCELTIVADHLFFNEIGEGSLEKTVMQMLWHVKEANAVFQSKVRFQLQLQSIGARL